MLDQIWPQSAAGILRIIQTCSWSKLPNIFPVLLLYLVARPAKSHVSSKVAPKREFVNEVGYFGNRQPIIGKWPSKVGRPGCQNGPKLGVFTEGVAGNRPGQKSSEKANLGQSWT